MNCRLCKNIRTIKLFSAVNMHGRHLWDGTERFDVKRCLDCGAVYIDGLKINDDYYRKYYPAGYYDEGTASGLMGLFLRWVTRLSLKDKENLMLRHSSDGPDKRFKVLDIGCGKGIFLDSLRSDKFDKFGIEINKAGYQECLKKNIRMSDKGIAESDFNEGFFDIITFWHVIEHLADPLATLNAAKRLLKKNGILIISTPNTQSLGFKLGRDLWFHLDAPRHPVLFNKKSIKFLTEEAGFEILAKAANFYDYPLDLFWSLRAHPYKIFFYVLYPLFKMINSETMTFVCRKR